MGDRGAARPKRGDRPFGEALARMTRSRARRMWSRMDGTIVGEDIEELHEMRVGSRRVRAAFDLCAGCYDENDYRRLRRVISQVTDQLGAVRDTDVMLDSLRQERERVPDIERPGLDYLIDHMMAERERLRPVLVTFLEGLREDGFPDRFQRFLRDGRLS